MQKKGCICLSSEIVNAFDSLEEEAQDKIVYKGWAFIDCHYPQASPIQVCLHLVSITTL
jgi:hypothetical protein